MLLITQSIDKKKKTSCQVTVSQYHDITTCKYNSNTSTMINVKHGYKRSCVLHTHMHVVQLGLRIVFTAVWAQPPSVFERCVARRVRFERLSLPLGSNFLIMAPPERSLVLERKNNGYY